MCALRGKTPRTLSNVRGVLRRCVATKELYPLRRQSGYLLKAKGVTVFEQVRKKWTIEKKATPMVELKKLP